MGFGDRSTGRGTFGANLGSAIVTNVEFTAHLCYSAAMRSSSQITFGKLVYVKYLMLSFTFSRHKIWNKGLGGEDDA